MNYNLLLEYINNNSSLKRDVVNVEGRNYLIDTHNLRDKFETVIFRCDNEGNITDYDEIAVVDYDNEDDAINNHNSILDNADEYIYKCINGEDDIAYNEHKYGLDNLEDEDENEYEYGYTTQNKENNKSDKILAFKYVDIHGEDGSIKHILLAVQENGSEVYVRAAAVDDKRVVINRKSLEFEILDGFVKMAKENGSYDFILDMFSEVLLPGILYKNLDQLYEARKARSFNDFMKLNEKVNLKSTIRNGLLGAMMIGAVSCTDMSEQEAIEMNKIKDPNLRAEIEMQSDEVSKILSWVNHMADSVYNPFDNRISQIGTDVFEEFLSDEFPTSRKLKKKSGMQPYFVNALKGRWHRFVYMPEDMTLDKLKEMWEKYYVENTTEAHRKLAKEKQYSDNPLYYKDTTPYHNGEIHQPLPGGSVKWKQGHKMKNR